MSFRVIIIAIAACMVLNNCFSQAGNKKRYEEYLQLYNKAENIYRAGEEIARRPDYSDEKETRLNRVALDAFHKLLSRMEQDKTDLDSLAFFCYLKTGILEHFFDNYSTAINAYTKSIIVKQRNPTLPDSLLFKPLLYSGIILYINNQFDSSLAVYKKAERITEHYKIPLQEEERLFNTLGALYNETGNYRQAKNYFEKALAIIPSNNPYYKELTVNYRINLAAVLTRLEEFDEAKRLYQSLLPVTNSSFRNAVLHNMGILNLKLADPERAISFFQQVRYSGSSSIRLFNDFGLAYYQLKKFDSAEFYLRKAEAVNRLTNKFRKNSPYGQTLKQWGDLLTVQGNIHEALQKYQSSITELYPDFNDTDIYSNPGKFSGVFSYIPLFNTLTGKADALELLYRRDKNLKDLEMSLRAYQSAFALADYVQKSYDSDEARLFLNKIKYITHSRPIEICLSLYEITRQKGFLEQAWQFDQRNKASILSFNIFESQLAIKNIPPELVKKQTWLKSFLTRLSLKAAEINDSTRLIEIKNEIRDKEIELGKLQEQLTELSGISSLDLTSKIPSIPQLQKMISHNTGVLSYHFEDQGLLIFWITKNDYGYQIIPGLKKIIQNIREFMNVLHEVNSDVKSRSDPISTKLYLSLIEPVRAHMIKITRLVIIPDDELNYVPFEALKTEDGKYLIEYFSIQYQYTASLLENLKNRYNPNDNLFVAPFSSSGAEGLNQLSYSREEIKNLPGISLNDQNATKEKFLQIANKFSIIHLATHARVNDTDPLRSFIAFYPTKTMDADNNLLYAREIYNMNLDSTRLIILSACETGSGELVHGEGLMSLSRAFAYAGCPAIVTSLWKAEDRTTAFLTKRFHHYLEKGYLIDKSLQHAKLDLLESSQIDPRFKASAYWAHLIYIGPYETRQSSYWYFWVAGFILIIFSFFVYQIYQSKKNPASD